MQKPGVITCGLCQWLSYLTKNFGLRYVEKYFYVIKIKYTAVSSKYYVHIFPKCIYEQCTLNLKFLYVYNNLYIKPYIAICIFILTYRASKLNLLSTILCLMIYGLSGSVLLFVITLWTAWFYKNISLTVKVYFYFLYNFIWKFFSSGRV